MLFGKNHLTLSHAGAGVTLRFDALGALEAWREAQLPALQVPFSDSWRQSRAKELEASQAKPLNYDWTYTTPYTGSLSCRSLAGLAWIPSDGGQPLNKALLLARDPILYYAELPLYESELDDNGVSRLEAKVRVMPRCAYVLLRFFLRVDNVLVRLRETRLLIEFDVGGGPGRVMREIKAAEGTFQDMAAAGAPPAASAAWSDVDSASLALQAVAPIGVKLFRTEVLAPAAAEAGAGGSTAGTQAAPAASAEEGEGGGRGEADVTQGDAGGGGQPSERPGDSAPA